MAEPPLPADGAARDYESHWSQSVGPPDVAAFLQAYASLPAPQVADILLLDIRLRRSEGLPIPLDLYRERFGEVFSQVELSREILAAAAGNIEPHSGAEQLTGLSNSSETERLQDTVICRTPVESNVDEQTAGDQTQDSADDDLWAEFDACWSGSDADAGASSRAPERQAVSGETLDDLAECDVFSQLPRPILQVLRDRMQARDYRDGELIIEQGQPGTHLIVVRSGVVDVWTWDDEGRQCYIDAAGRGQILGEMALLTDAPRSANAVARGEVACLLLPADEFHVLARQHPDISIVLTHLLASRLGASERDVLSGKTLGSYFIRRRLGRGGTSIVYEGAHIETGLRAAVKMMSHRLVYDPSARARFETEAAIIQSFSHENIVRLHGSFSAFQTYFLAMEFCDGVTLHDLIAAHGPLPVDEVRAILGQLAKALSYAHGHGIVHRDLKPANLMLNRDGIVKLTDFGLAKPVTDLLKSRESALVGTPRYMAPELFRGQPASPQTDAFAVGCLAFEMLVGQSLYKGETVTELFEEHRQPITASTLVELHRIDDELSRLLESLLSVEPKARFGRWEELAGWARPVGPELTQSATTEPPSPSPVSGEATRPLHRD